MLGRHIVCKGPDRNFWEMTKYRNEALDEVFRQESAIARLKRALVRV